VNRDELVAHAKERIRFHRNTPGLSEEAAFEAVEDEICQLLGVEPGTTYVEGIVNDAEFQIEQEETA
jgi:hypothetical protein